MLLWKNKSINKAWVECYNSIRKFYKNKIMIIDDNSNKEFLSDINLENTIIIESSFKGRGEILPYYYFLKYKFCNKLFVMHDSMILRKKIDFSKFKDFKNFTRVFSFPNACYKIDIKYFKDFCECVKRGDNILKYHNENKNRLIGCFGVCYFIDYDFLEFIERKYSISDLTKIVDNRDKRKLLKDFYLVYLRWNIIQKNAQIYLVIYLIQLGKKSNESVVIEKLFFGR